MNKHNYLTYNLERMLDKKNTVTKEYMDISELAHNEAVRLEATSPLEREAISFLIRALIYSRVPTPKTEIAKRISIKKEAVNAYKQYHTGSSKGVFRAKEHALRMQVKLELEDYLIGKSKWMITKERKRVADILGEPREASRPRRKSITDQELAELDKVKAKDTIVITAEDMKRARLAMDLENAVEEPKLRKCLRCGNQFMTIKAIRICCKVAGEAAYTGDEIYM